MHFYRKRVSETEYPITRETWCKRVLVRWALDLEIIKCEWAVLMDRDPMPADRISREGLADPLGPGNGGKPHRRDGSALRSAGLPRVSGDRAALTPFFLVQTFNCLVHSCPQNLMNSRDKQVWKDYMIPLFRGSSARIGTMQRRLGGPRRKDDTHGSRNEQVLKD